jgi:hypothetical protein
MTDRVGHREDNGWPIEWKHATFKKELSMKRMPGVRTAAAMIALAAVGSVSSIGVGAVEPQQGRWYSFHTATVGTCPGLDWHVVIDETNAVSGFVSWDRMKHMATITGQIKADGSFSNVATEVGGAHRVADITGKVGQDVLTLSLDGTGTGCDKQTWKVRRAVDSGGVGGGSG